MVPRACHQEPDGTPERATTIATNGLPLASRTGGHPVHFWRRIEPWEYAVAAVPVIIVGLIALPYLPRGICFGDHGDFQVASITLGIMHPPGYPGFTSLGFLWSRIPWGDKPFLITLGCLGSGLGALWLCSLMQMRLGVHAVLAAIMALWFAAHKRFWFNALMPEVYMPALVFLVWAAYALMKYARTGQRRDLVISSLCVGFCLGNRPTALLVVPFFVLALMAAERRSGHSVRYMARRVGLATGVALLPLLYSFTYVLIRDTPETTYNYIEQYHQTHQALPEASASPAARFRRAVWLFSAEQFRSEFGTSWSGVYRKLRWFRQDFMGNHPVQFGMVLLLILMGWAICLRRDSVAAWLLTGMGVHSVLFICIYRVYGQAADLAPFVFSATVMLGIVLSAVVREPWKRFHVAGLGCVGIAMIVGIWSFNDIPRRWSVSREVDATAFLAELDLATVPDNSLILSGWSHAVPLWYAQQLSPGRWDVDILAGEPAFLATQGEEVDRRPVLLVDRSSSMSGLSVEPFRNIWKVVAEKVNR